MIAPKNTTQRQSSIVSKVMVMVCVRPCVLYFFPCLDFKCFATHFVSVRAGSTRPQLDTPQSKPTFEGGVSSRSSLCMESRSPRGFCRSYITLKTYKVLISIHGDDRKGNWSILEQKNHKSALWKWTCTLLMNERLYKRSVKFKLLSVAPHEFVQSVVDTSHH